MTYFAVFYSYIDDSEALATVRPDHRAFLARLRDAGKLVMSGPLQDDEGGALIVISLDGEIADVEKLLDDDPFYRANMITERRVRPWDVVLTSF